MVDDNRAQREILQAYLAAQGMQVACLPDATSALRVLRHSAQRGLPVDIALLDLMMPGVNGFALA